MGKLGMFKMKPLHKRYYVDDLLRSANNAIQKPNYYKSFWISAFAATMLFFIFRMPRDASPRGLYANASFYSGKPETKPKPAG